MIFSRKLIFVVIGVALTVGVLALAYVIIPRPRAEFAETNHDFGTVDEDQGLTHTFVIKNRGSSSLKIRGVHPECACTATAYDRLIPPGGQGAVTLSIKPFALRGQFAKKTEVFLNDPDQPRLVFTLKGASRPLIEIQPSKVIRFRGKPGEDIHHQVRLTSHLPESWEIRRYTNNISQFIDINIHPAEPRRSYVIEVIQKRQEPGQYQGMIELFTTSRKWPYIVLRVFGEVLPR